LFRSDVRLLGDLLRRGGILYVVADAAGTPAARVLIQPDADILMTVERHSDDCGAPLPVRSDPEHTDS
jgi:hypothetical protein